MTIHLDYERINCSDLRSLLRRGYAAYCVGGYAKVCARVRNLLRTKYSIESDE